jgi:hypothetical protein
MILVLVQLSDLKEALAEVGSFSGPVSAIFL